MDGMAIDDAGFGAESLLGPENFSNISACNLTPTVEATRVLVAAVAQVLDCFLEWAHIHKFSYTKCVDHYAAMDGTRGSGWECPILLTPYLTATNLILMCISTIVVFLGAFWTLVYLLRLAFRRVSPTLTISATTDVPAGDSGADIAGKAGRPGRGPSRPNGTDKKKN